MPDTALLTRAALATREDVDNGAGAVTRTADQLFARFGFQPSSYEEQRLIEDALRAAGVRVEPLDSAGRQIRLLRSETAVAPVAPVAPAPAAPAAPRSHFEEPPRANSSNRWTLAAMVVVVVLALGGAAGGVKYLHDQAEHNNKATATQSDPSTVAPQTTPAPPGGLLGD